MVFKRITTILISIILAVALPVTSLANNGRAKAPGQLKKQQEINIPNLNKSINHGEAIKKMLEVLGYKDKDYIEEAVKRGIILQEEFKKFNANRSLSGEDAYRYLSRLLESSMGISGDLVKDIESKKSFKWSDFVIAMARLENALKGQKDQTALSGVIAAIDIQAAKITLVKEDKTSISYEISSDTKIYKENKAITIDKLSVGDRGIFYLSKGKVTTIMITEIYLAPKQKIVEGVIKTIDVSNKKITINTGDKKVETCEVIADTRIYRNNKLEDISKLVAGDKVSIYIIEDKVIYIIVTEIFQDQLSWVDGVVSNIASDGKTFSIQTSTDLLMSFSITDQSQAIYHRGARVSFGSIRLKDNVRIALRNNVVEYVIIKSSEQYKISGIIKNVDFHNMRFSFKDDVTHVIRSFDIVNLTILSISNSNLDFRNIAPNMKVELTVQDERVTHLKAGDNIETRVGKFHQILEGGHVVMIVDDNVEVYTVEETTEILIRGQQKSLKDITQGMPGYILKVDNKVVRVVVTY